MSASEEEVRKQQEEARKKAAPPGGDPPKPDSSYVPPKDPSGVTGSTKQVGGKSVNELGYKIASPNGDELSASVQQDNKNGTTTAKAKISDGENTVEASVREQKGKEAVEVRYTRQQSDSEKYSVSAERNNETGRTTAKVEHQEGKDQQSLTVSGGKGGPNAAVAITEEMGKNGTLKAEVSTNLNDRFKVGGGYSKDGISGSFATEKAPDGWTNTYGAGVEKGRVKVEASVKDAPEKPLEVSVKGTINVGPTPGKAEPTFWDKPELKQTPEEYAKFCKARDQLSPEDRKLYETSLAAVTKAIESGQPGMAAYKGRETELAMNAALQAKTLGMTEVADLRTQVGPNGQPMVRLGEKSLEDPALDTRNGPSSKTISLNALDKPPMDAMSELKSVVTEKAPAKNEVPSPQLTTDPPKDAPAQDSPVQRR